MAPNLCVLATFKRETIHKHTQYFGRKTSANVVNNPLLEFGLDRSRRGIARPSTNSFRPPSRRDYLARPGLASLARNLTARLLSILARPGLVRPLTDILRVNHARPTPNTSANPSKRPISDGDDGDSYADNKDGDGDHVGNENNINDGDNGNNNSGRRTAAGRTTMTTMMSSATTIQRGGWDHDGQPAVGNKKLASTVPHPRQQCRQLG